MIGIVDATLRQKNRAIVESLPQIPQELLPLEFLFNPRPKVISQGTDTTVQKEAPQQGALTIVYFPTSAKF
jgi:hypothetical protein